MISFKELLSIGLMGVVFVSSILGPIFLFTFLLEHFC